MTVYELLDTYNCGAITWKKFTGIGVAPNSVQYNVGGDAEHHITVYYDAATGQITGVHYTIRNEANTLFHLYYYLDTNEYRIDFAGTRNPQTINMTLVKSRLAAWCVVSMYSANADTGTFQNLAAFNEKVESEKAKNVPQQQIRKKKGKNVVFLDLTGGGGRKY